MKRNNQLELRKVLKIIKVPHFTQILLLIIQNILCFNIDGNIHCIANLFIASQNRTTLEEEIQEVQAND